MLIYCFYMTMTIYYWYNSINTVSIKSTNFYLSCSLSFIETGLLYSIINYIIFQEYYIKYTSEDPHPGANYLCYIEVLFYSLSFKERKIPNKLICPLFWQAVWKFTDLAEGKISISPQPSRFHVEIRSVLNKSIFHTL